MTSALFGHPACVRAFAMVSSQAFKKRVLSCQGVCLIGTHDSPSKARAHHTTHSQAAHAECALTLHECMLCIVKAMTSALFGHSACVRAFAMVSSQAFNNV